MRGTRFTLRLAIAALGAAMFAASPAWAQVKLSTPDSTVPQKHKHLFNHRDLIIAGALTATTLAMFPLDRELATTLQEPNNQSNKFFLHASNGFEVITSPGAFLIGGGLYVVGRFGGKPRLADLGWHGTEAVLIGEGIVFVLKGAVGRNRPYVSGATEPNNFSFGTGFTDPDRRSFPSGHTTTAFAAAAAVTDETSLWWPKSTWIVGPIMYGGATLVGLSRMYHNRHWASDVALGALIGTFSGKKVVLASHDNPNNFLDRIILGTQVAPAQGGGLKIGWVVPKQW